MGKIAYMIWIVILLMGSLIGKYLIWDPYQRRLAYRKLARKKFELELDVLKYSMDALVSIDIIEGQVKNLISTAKDAKVDFDPSVYRKQYPKIRKLIKETEIRGYL